MSTRPPPFFILGAGFGVDAGTLVGPTEAESIHIGKYQFNCAYPLVRDLPRICFPDATPAVQVAEVEKRLGEAVEAGNHDPIDRLCEELARADCYIIPKLLGWKKRPNPYAKFFDDFPGSSFATYNYDAFVEFALFWADRWSPHDGYGVKVAVDQKTRRTPYQKRDSSSLVLHLHGSYLVYSYSYSFGAPDINGVRRMDYFDTPRFAFDPHSLGDMFHPFQKFMADHAYNHELQIRIVAPIPDKAKELRAEFVRRVTRKAMNLIAENGQIVVIGYAFASHDEASYSELLETLNATSHPRAVIVSPEASEIVARLKPLYSRVEWVVVDLGFAAWVEKDYPKLK